MPWRLIVTIFAVSAQGSVAVESTHSDWATEAECKRIIKSSYTSPPTAEIGGIKLTVVIGAHCVRFGQSERPPEQRSRPSPPPPPPPPPSSFYPPRGIPYYPE